MNRNLLTARWASGVLLVATIIQPAMAQDGPQEGQGAAFESAGDIVVTARRRAENLLDVPVAVTAYSGSELEARGAIDITDIAATTPNVTLENSRGTNSTLTAFIRGTGQQDPVSGFEGGVGIYIDDVYLNRPQAAVLDIYDVERIEVLRGPQGTLYGRNSIGGAVKYVTRRLPDHFELKLRAAYGSYDQADGIVTVSAPIGDQFRVGGSVARLSRGGFGDNLTNGLENYNKDIWAGRGTVEFASPDDHMLIRISGDYTRDKSDPRNGHRVIPGVFSGTPVLSDVYDTRAGANNPPQNLTAYGLTMTASAELTDAVTLRSISAWRRDRSKSPIDFDALPAIDVDGPIAYRNEQVSQEFQLLYETSRLNGLIGFYYLDADSETFLDLLVFTTLPNLNAATESLAKTRTWSVFGDFTFDLSDQFAVSLGGRYTSDQRTGQNLRQNRLGTSAIFGGNPIVLSTSSNFRGERTFRKFTPRASLTYKPTPDHTLYVSYAKGFKGGGFDPRGASTAARDFNDNGVVDAEDVFEFMSFDPETVDSYEVGWKASLFDRRMRFALAGFYADYKDVQIPGAVGFDSDGDGSNETFIGITTNAAQARFKGLEFETSALLARDFAGSGSAFNVSGSLGYIDAKFLQFIDARGVEVADLRRFQNTPKWTLSGQLGIDLPVASGMLHGSTTLSYRSKTTQLETPSPLLDQPKYALLDASLVWTSKNDRYSIGLHAKNITDKQYITSGYQILFTAPDGTPLRDAQGRVRPQVGREGVATAFYGNPRQIFVSFGAKF